MSVILWSLWLERNDRSFNDVSWPTSKLLHKIWLGLVDYGRAEWAAVSRVSPFPRAKRTRAVTNFVKCWCRQELFASLDGDQPQWKLVVPVGTFVVS